MLRIGHIDYANCTPIFSTLQTRFTCNNYQFVKGVPAELNRQLHRGELDICPSSSIEYGKHANQYYILPDLSISAIGTVKSVLLFSSTPIEQLDNQAVGLTAESDTSVNLLKIILGKFYGYSNSFIRTDRMPQVSGGDFIATLLIGDKALMLAQQNKGFHVYDLGELWFRFTGLPFVFALWIVREETAIRQGKEVISLCRDLVAAKQLAYASYDTIAAGCTETAWMQQETLVDYWRTISYDLGPRHLEGVSLFFQYAAEMGLLERAPEIRLLADGT